jgi:hypothetical protein
MLLVIFRCRTNSYTMTLPDFIGTVSNARLQGGSPDPSDVDDTVVQQALKFGHEQLILWSGKSLWTGNERTINQAGAAEEFFAGSWLRTAFRDPENKSQELFNRGKAMCVAMQENQKAVEDNPSNKSSYTSTTCTMGQSTNAKNEDVKRYTSPRVDI